MPDSTNKLLQNIILFLVIVGILLSFARLAFISRAFYDPDSYYNTAVAGFIRDYGLHYKFRWTQFSIFKDSFADKDIMLHIFTLPFLYLSSDPVYAGKLAIITSLILFVAVYVFILKKYLPDYLAALFLLLPFFSPIFSVYILELRSVSMANVLLLLGVYSLINKKTFPLLLISVLYPLTHISFPLLVVSAVLCEVIRYLSAKEFFAKNIYAVLAGCIIGCLIHPDFPRNLLYVYLNGILVPFYNFTGTDLGFSGELKALEPGRAFFYNFALFFGVGAIFLNFLKNKKHVGLATRMWFATTVLFLIAALFGTRYWYQANAFFFVAASSYICDTSSPRQQSLISLKAMVVAVMVVMISLALLISNLVTFKEFLIYLGARNMQYEDIAREMKNDVPEGETVYHSYWDDSSYFICLNSKNNYLNTNDPIYMFYSHPREFDIMNNLSIGNIGNIHEVIAGVFKARYGFVRKIEPLSRQITADKKRFKILYENDEGFIFELI